MTTPTTDINEPVPPIVVAQFLDSIDDRIITLGRTVDALAEQVNEIHGFASRLAATLDALGENPMVAAMLPPGTFS